MDVETLEAEVLKLDTQSRARLAERLLASLDGLSEQEAAQAWAVEAQRRDAEMDTDPGRERPSEDVFRDVHSRFK